VRASGFDECAHGFDTEETIVAALHLDHQSRRAVIREHVSRSPTQIPSSKDAHHPQARRCKLLGEVREVAVLLQRDQIHRLLVETQLRNAFHSIQWDQRT
jgi:hypothetical protein